MVDAREQHANSTHMTIPTRDDLISDLNRAIPASFYADRDVVFRVQQLVAQWRTATVAAQELEQELSKWKAENAKLKSELLEG